MHFTQQSALAVVVFATASLAAPIDIEARSIGNLASSGVESFWHEASKRSNLDEMNAAIDRLTSRDTTLEAMNAEIDRLVQRDTLDEMNAEINRLTSKRSTLDEMNAEIDRLTSRDTALAAMNAEIDRLVQRDTLDEMNAEINRLTSRDTALAAMNAEIDRLVQRDTLDEMNAEINRLTSKRSTLDEMNAEIDRLTTRSHADELSEDPDYIEARDILEARKGGVFRGALDAVSNVVGSVSSIWSSISGFGQKRSLMEEEQFEAPVEARDPGLFGGNKNKDPNAPKTSKTDGLNKAADGANALSGVIDGVHNVWTGVKNFFGGGSSEPAPVEPVKRAVAFRA